MKSLFITLCFMLLPPFLSAQKGDYTFRMEMYGGRPLMIVSTTATFACSNYGIFIRQGWSRDTLTMNIIGIDSRNRCNNVLDVAREYVALNGVPMEEFTLRFLHKNRVNFFHVEFDGESFSVSPIESDFIFSVSR